MNYVNQMNQMMQRMMMSQLQSNPLFRQAQTLVNELRPCAKPAYITCSPYQTSNFGYGCGGCCN